MGLEKKMGGPGETDNQSSHALGFSAQRYDPRQVSQNLVRCAEPHKNFSRSIQSQTVGCVKHNFWDTSETFLRNRVAKEYENSKIAKFARLVA